MRLGEDSSNITYDYKNSSIENNFLIKFQNFCRKHFLVTLYIIIALLILRDQFFKQYNWFFFNLHRRMPLNILHSSAVNICSPILNSNFSSHLQQYFANHCELWVQLRLNKSRITFSTSALLTDISFFSFSCSHEMNFFSATAISSDAALFEVLTMIWKQSLGQMRLKLS